MNLQIEYSLGNCGPETEIFSVLRVLGIGATLYGVLFRELLTGSRAHRAGNFRAGLPRFSEADG